VRGGLEMLCGSAMTAINTEVTRRLISFMARARIISARQRSADNNNVKMAAAVLNDMNHGARGRAARKNKMANGLLLRAHAPRLAARAVTKW